MWRTVIAVLISAAFALAQDGGPFGLRAGMTRKQVEQTVGAKALVSEDGDDVTYSTVPQPHPDFNSYKLTFSRTRGLVRLVAESKDIDEDKTLASTSAKCLEIQAVLAVKYGKPEVSPKTQCPLKVDEGRPCTAPTAFYDYRPASVPPREDRISRVDLAVLVLPWVTDDRGERVTAGCHDPRSRLAGQIIVIYTFDDFERYEEEIKKVF